MSPPKTTLAERTANSATGASQSRTTPAPVPASRKLGNEQTLKALRARQAKVTGAPSPDESTDRPESDPWRTLSAAGRTHVQQLYSECVQMMLDLNSAQAGHGSVRRTAWITGLAQLQSQINALDTDAKIAGVERAFENYSGDIFKAVEGFSREWLVLERRYIEERDWLRFQRVDDMTLAAEHLEKLYAEFRDRVDRGGAGTYITSEDYSEVKTALDSGSHRALGTLQASRLRARDAHHLLDVVRELRVDHQNPDKHVADWRKLVDDEVQELDQLSKRPPATRGSDASAQYVALRDDLRKQREAVLQTIANEDSTDAIKKAASKHPAVMVGMAAVGAAEAIVEPLVELAREILDDVQIGLFYVSGQRYTPKFTSDLMKALEHGASRTDVLMGMAEGIIGTPGRLLKAAEDGNWEEVGREAMNLYGLVELVKASPKYLGKASAALGITRLAARIVRARTFGLRLRAPRLRITSQPPKVPPVPREPVYLGNDPAGEPRPNPQHGPGATPPRYGPTTPPPPLPDRPTILVDSQASALSRIFEQLGGRELGYTVEICNDSTVVETPTTRHNVGLNAKHLGGAFTDTASKTVWIHESVLAEGGIIRRWGRLTLSQVVAHELGHVRGGFSCVEASRLGADLPGLTATERQGLLDDALHIERQLSGK